MTPSMLFVIKCKLQSIKHYCYVLRRQTALAENAPSRTSRLLAVRLTMAIDLGLAKSSLEPTLAFVCVNSRW